MGLLEQEIKELRTMNKQLMSGKISADDVNARIAIYSQTEKRAKMILSAFSIGAKHGMKMLGNIQRSNLIGDGTCIDLETDVEVEQISCPDLDKIISRAECLDYSGETAHVVSCGSCEQFPITRKLLIPEK